MNVYFRSLCCFAAALALSLPSFAAGPIVDFDGQRMPAYNAAYMPPNPSPSTPPSEYTIQTPEAVRTLERRIATGGFVEIHPSFSTDKGGRPVKSYTIEPDWLIRWKISCPAKGTWSYKIAYSWNTEISGHNHSSPPPPSLRVSHNQSDQIPQDFVSTPSPITFSASLPGNNVPVYYWIEYPPFAAEIVDLEDAWGVCHISQRETRIEVRISDELVPVENGTGFIIDGNTTKHKDTHYVTSDFRDQLLTVGALWDQMCPNSKKPYPLTYLQMSLPWGGLFDINGDWKPPHLAHRFGTNSDVSKWRVRKGNREKLVNLICDYADVYSEGNAADESSPVYHLVARSSRHPEDSPGAMDPKYIACCTKPVPEKCINLEANGNPIPEHKEVPVETDCP